jgi:alcohol dehydrogenase
VLSLLTTRRRTYWSWPIGTCFPDVALQGAIDDLRRGTRISVVEHDGNEPSIAQAMELSQQSSSAIDLIVAVSGGSTIDIAKALALTRRAHGQPLAEFEGAQRVDFEPLPLIAVPTTAGTGSEVTGSCVLTDAESARKVSIRSQKLRPRVAIIDPQFLASVLSGVIRSLQGSCSNS